MSIDPASASSWRTIAEVDALGHRTSSTYDAAGRAIAVTDANDHTTSKEKGKEGRFNAPASASSGIIAR